MRKCEICYTANVKKPEDAALYNAVALCAVGAEKAVSNEVKKLGLGVTDSGFGRVRFRADIAGLYLALMGLRAADRILLETTVFSAADFDALFEGTEAVSWEQIIPPQMGLKVAKVRSNRSQLKAETSIQAVVHKAAAQRLCRAHGLKRLPDGNTTAEIRVYVEKDMVSLLLDLSGAPLFKRGYRKEGGIAPLRETTAAAMLLLSGWKRKYPLYDPFCGSGTILIEALMYAWDMVPGLGRAFALNDLLIADNKIEETIRGELSGRINFERVIRIAGSDENADAVKLAGFNLRRALGIAQGRRHDGTNGPALPEIKAAPMNMASPPFDVCAGDGPHGFMVTNPPYGKRLGDTAVSQRIYGEMAGLSRNFPHWKLAVITDHSGFESYFGKKADSCREISNGSVPSYFYQYEKL